MDLAGDAGRGRRWRGVLVLWAWYQLRALEPLLNLRVAARPAVLLTNLAAVGIGFALYGSNITFPQLLALPVASGTGFGLSLLGAALIVMPAGLVMLLVSPVAGRLSRTVGPACCWSVVPARSY